MRIIENNQLNTLIILFNYHIDRVREYSAKHKKFDLKNFYDKLPKSFAKDKLFISINGLGKIAKEIEEQEVLSIADLSTIQNQFWAPYFEIISQVNGK